VRCCGGHIGIAGTPKNSKMIIGPLGGVEGGVWCREGEGFSGQPVHKVCRSVKGFNLVDRRETRLE
jgi:hypothetical protein